MSGIVSGVDYSLLFSPGSASSSGADPILNALYGNAGAASGPTSFVSSGNPILDLKLAQADQTADVAQEARQPQVKATIAQFTKAIASAPDIQTALLNPYVQKVLLTANGLSSYIGQTALVQKAFLSDPSQPQSLVNQLGNSQLTSAVGSYDFARNGLSPLKNPSVIATLTNAYAEVAWRQSLDRATPGLSNALTFLSGASSIKSASDVVANPIYFDVVTTALGIPPQIVNQSTTAVNKALDAKLHYSQLQTPSYVTSLTDQYLLTMQANTQSASGSGTDITSLAVQAGSLIV